MNAVLNAIDAELTFVTGWLAMACMSEADRYPDPSLEFDPADPKNEHTDTCPTLPADGRRQRQG